MTSCEEPVAQTEEHVRGMDRLQGYPVADKVTFGMGCLIPRKL